MPQGSLGPWGVCCPALFLLGKSCILGAKEEISHETKHLCADPVPSFADRSAHPHGPGRRGEARLFPAAPKHHRHRPGHRRLHRPGHRRPHLPVAGQGRERLAGYSGCHPEHLHHPQHRHGHERPPIPLPGHQCQRHHLFRHRHPDREERPGLRSPGPQAHHGAGHPPARAQDGRQDVLCLSPGKRPVRCHFQLEPQRRPGGGLRAWPGLRPLPGPVRQKRLHPGRPDPGFLSRTWGRKSRAD